MAIDETVFDARVVERNIQKGIITRADYEKYIADLSDKEGDAVTVEAEFETNILNGGNSDDEDA